MRFPWQVIRTPRTSSAGRSGKLMFRRVSLGRPCRRTFRAACRANSAAASNRKWLRDASETAIEGIPRIVRPLVDSGGHEGDLLLPQDAVHSKIYAVGGSTVHGVYPVADLLDPERVRKGQGVAGRALFTVWRDDIHRAQLAQRIREGDNPFRAPSLIVAHQDVGRRFLQGRPGGSNREKVGRGDWT